MNASTARQEALFTLALAKPAAERGAFLERECGGDTTLRLRIEALLAAHEQTDNLLATDLQANPRPTISLQILDLPPDESVGQTLGRYKLLERIGEGGCGVVYVAEQIEPVRRRVALKVIKLGMDTKQVVARFEAERQALAMMDHPNIAKVLDAGTTLEAPASRRPVREGEEKFEERAGETPALPAGRPYFVMELVRGIRITDYCDQAKLNAQARLDLFIKVCQAIQHAHQKGIIHRDIKPSNILVTLHDGVPVPKVIDFGIAKATEGRLTDATVYTQLHQFIGTPAYMSPEQAEMSGLDIDTRSDIYSLGVLLYELLAGSTPFDARELMASGIDAMRKTIREKEPMRPSTRLAALKAEERTTTAKHRSVEVPKLVHQLQGDLDWVVMKCLEKDRARRYETANGLAADLKRHLDNEPVVARPPSVAYRFQKAWRRNRLLFTAGGALAGLALVALLAVVGLAVAIPANRKLAAARDSEAEQRREKQQALERAEIALYHRNMAWAEREWQANNVARVLELLTKCPEADRGWEWHRLNRLCHSDLLTLTNTSSLQSVTWHPSGHWLLGGSLSGSQLWDAHRGVAETRIGTLSPPFVGFLPGGFESIGVAPVGESWRLIISDLMTGEQRLLETPMAKESVLALSPDGSLLAAGSPEGEVRLTKLGVTGDNHSPRVFTGAVEKVNGVAFSPIGGRLAICTGKQRSTQGEREIPEQPGSVVLWDPDHDESHVLASGGSVFLCVAFSFDGDYVMAGTADHTIRVWETTSRKWIATLRGHSAAVLGLSASPNSQQLASCSADSTIRVWDLAERKELRIFRGHQGEVTGVAFSPNGRCLASTSSDRTVKVWDALAPSDEFQYQTTDRVSSVAFDPKSTRVAIAAKSLEHLNWPAAPAQLLWQGPLSSHTGVYPQVIYDPSGRYIATAGGREVELRFSGSGQIARKLIGGKFAVNGLAYSPDGTWLASGSGVSGPGEVRIFRPDTGGLIRELPQHTNAVWSVAASPDGRYLASASGSFSPLTGPGKPGEVIVWDVASGNRVLTLATRCCCYRVAFSPDGRFVASVGGLYHIGNKSPNPGEINVWDAKTGRLIWWRDDPASCIFALAFSPDGRRLATAGGKTKRQAPGTVKLWDVPTGDEVLTLSQHSAAIYSLDFSRDGWRLASASDDKTVRISDARLLTTENLRERRRELLGIQPEMDVLWIQAASQRIEAAAASNATNLALWRTVGRLRKNTGQREAAAEAYTHALALAGNNRELRTPIQQERYDLLFKLGRTNEAIAANLDWLGIPARDPHANQALVDLSIHYTASFTNHPWARAERDNVVEFPVGIRSLNGIDFELRGICHTVPWGGREYFSGIRVGRLCRRIHFLHAAFDGQEVGNSWKDGTVVGRYVIHRKGLPDESRPLALGPQLGLLYREPAATNSATAPNVAWTSSAENSLRLGRTTRLFHMTWENPKPDALVETIDLLPELNSPVSPVLFAITVED